MALVTRNNRDFSLQTRNPLEHGDNVVFIKGGSVVVEDTWVHLSDLRIDLKDLIDTYVRDNSRRLFNSVDGVLYVLVTLDATGKVDLIPSVAFNRKSFGDLKIFPDLSGKLPLIMVKLQQDGSSDLSAFKNIEEDDIEIYDGHGNFTVRGAQGDEGYKGITGTYGVTGVYGLTGYQGVTGPVG